MPKELFDHTQTDEFSKYLKGALKQIKTIESTHSHTTIVYWIPPTNTNEFDICDNCGDKATFLLYDKDHWCKTSINLWCDTHVNPHFKQWLNEEK